MLRALREQGRLERKWLKKNRAKATGWRARWQWSAAGTEWQACTRELQKPNSPHVPALCRCCPLHHSHTHFFSPYSESSPHASRYPSVAQCGADLGAHELVADVIEVLLQGLHALGRLDLQVNLHMVEGGGEGRGARAQVRQRKSERGQWAGHETEKTRSETRACEPSPLQHTAQLLLPAPCCGPNPGKLHGARLKAVVPGLASLPLTSTSLLTRT